MLTRITIARKFKMSRVILQNIYFSHIESHLNYFLSSFFKISSEKVFIGCTHFTKGVITKNCPYCFRNYWRTLLNYKVEEVEEK